MYQFKTKLVCKRCGSEMDFLELFCDPCLLDSWKVAIKEFSVCAFTFLFFGCVTVISWIFFDQGKLDSQGHIGGDERLLCSVVFALSISAIILSLSAVMNFVFRKSLKILHTS